MLEEVGFQSPETIQKKLETQFGIHRTLTAIEAKRQRMQITANMDGLNLSQLADALGVTKRTVARWLERRRIRAVLRFPHLQSVNRHVWFFHNAEIRRFILQNLECIDLCRVEKQWFVSILTTRAKKVQGNGQRA